MTPNSIPQPQSQVSFSSPRCTAAVHSFCLKVPLTHKGFFFIISFFAFPSQFPCHPLCSLKVELLLKLSLCLPHLIATESGFFLLDRTLSSPRSLHSVFLFTYHLPAGTVSLGRWHQPPNSLSYF